MGAINNLQAGHHSKASLLKAFPLKASLLRAS
jgi:hypothetical protein